MDQVLRDTINLSGVAYKEKVLILFIPKGGLGIQMWKVVMYRFIVNELRVVWKWYKCCYYVWLVSYQLLF